MKKISASALRDFFTDDAAGAEIDAKKCTRILFFTILIWAGVWILAPMLCIKGLFFDVAENLEWGRYWQFGYDKHPFVSMWITRAVYELTGSAALAMYALCQISVALAVLCVWRLASKMLPPGRAFAAAMLLYTLQYFGTWSLEFNNDVIALPVWAGATLFFYNAITMNKLRDWLLTAFLCAVAVMTKYYAATLPAAFGWAALFSPEGRRCLKGWKPYAAALLFAALVAPNVVWLFRHDFAPFTYAAEGAHMGEGRFGGGIAARVIFSLKFFGSILERTAPLLLGFALIFFRRPRKEAAQHSFATFFISSVLFVPLALTLAVPAITGGHIKDTWLASCFNLLGIWLFMVFPAKVTPRRAAALVGYVIFALLVFGGDFAYAKLYRNAYSSKGSRCPYEAYPGKEIAEAATAIWRERFDTPLKYVTGTRYADVYMSLYSPDHPHSFHLADVKVSNWVDYDDLLKHGTLIIWEIRKDNDAPPEFLENFGEHAKRIVRLENLTFDRLHYGGKPPRSVNIGIAVLPPLP